MYLFFDIECANTTDGICKMCSFGYVISDSSFNIIVKEDLIINPESQFDWYFFKKGSNIQMAYPKDVYLTYPNFKEQYEKIASILNGQYKAIYGYDVAGDLKFLDQSYQRYNLEPIKIEALDVLKISKETGGYIGKLSKLPKELIFNESIDLVSHKSADDAHKTMLVLKSLEGLKNHNNS